MAPHRLIRLSRLSRSSALLLAIAMPATALAAADCGVPGTMKIKTPDGQSTMQAATRVFADGSIAVRARLAVNPDGATASYTVGDGGFTYIANGLDRWQGGATRSCQSGGCRADFLQAERQGFGPGSPAFCVYALEVEPLAAGGSITSCGPGKAVVGNGLGRPRLGPEVDGMSGQPVKTYVSTTSLRHVVDGKPRYLDSAALPIAVTPQRDLLGKVAWVGGRGMQPTLALIGDTGPAFGEGSIALHQLLRWGAVAPQKPGPIPLDQRCGADELALREPFRTFPDATGDRCRAGHTATSRADVRAYVGIDTPLDFVVLGRAALLKPGTSVIPSEVSPRALQDAASGYAAQDIQRMLACLPQ
jgi:hypothetical protein